jgi:hypothetical protein
VTFAYQPYWCEENIWQLAGSPEVGPGERIVLVITGVVEETLCWQQQLAPPGQPVRWDYHVVLAVRNQHWQVWDFDTRLGHPVAAETWLHGTFPRPAAVPVYFQPRFGWFPADQWRREFSSDRQHMRSASGGWQQPPPPWPPIQGASTGTGLPLASAIAQAREGLDLAQLASRWGLTPR